MDTTAVDKSAATNTLEQRVQKLELYVKVVAGVAVVFGVTGAWGFNALSTANKKLDELKNGITTVESARDRALAEIDQRKIYAVRDLAKTEADEIADIQLKAKPLVKEAMSQEMAQQIGSAKKWTALVYTLAAADAPPPGGGANGWWQTHLLQQNALAQSELK